MGSSAPRQHRTPALGLGLALLFLVSQLTSFTHLLLVRHATCLAHGELIHVDASAVAEAAPAHELPAYVAAPPQRTGEADEHCLVATSRREEQLAPPASVGGVHGPAPTAATSISLTAAPSLSVALLRLAPKSSPPA